MNGRLWPFRYRELPLYGALLQLGDEWSTLVRERGYTGAAPAVLGQSLCAVGLLSGIAKNPPRLTLQLSDAEGLDLLVAQTLRQGQLRGMLKPAQLVNSPFSGQGRLVMTLEPPGSPASPRQSIVPLAGENLAAALRSYFEHSEQLPSRFYLHADDEQAFGIVVQRVAEEGAAVDEAFAVLDNWALRELPPEPQHFLAVLLERDIEVLAPTQDWLLACHCDESSVSRMLLAMGLEEARTLLAERDHIAVECGYCGAEYRYDAAHVEQLFAAQASGRGTQLKH